MAAKLPPHGAEASLPRALSVVCDVVRPSFINVQSESPYDLKSREGARGVHEHPNLNLSPILKAEDVPMSGCPDVRMSRT